MKKHHRILLFASFVIIAAAGALLLGRNNKTNLDQGLVAWFRFDQNLSDASGFHQHASNKSGVSNFVADRKGNPSSAILMNGKTDLLTATVSPKIEQTGILSISVYYKLNSTAVQNLICRRKKFDCYTPGDFGGLSWSLNACSQREPHFAVVSPEDIDCESPRGIDRYTDIVYGMAKLDTGQWYHVACVFDAGVQRIYINGKLRQSLSRPFQKIRNCDTTMWVIGGFVNELPVYFNGVIDDIRIYNRAITDEELEALARDLSGT